MKFILFLPLACIKAAVCKTQWCKSKVQGSMVLVYDECKRVIGCRRRLGDWCGPISNISKTVTGRRQRCLHCALMLSRQWQWSVCLLCVHSCLPVLVTRTPSTWQYWLKTASTMTDQCHPSRSPLCVLNELLVKRRMLRLLELQVYAAFLCAASLSIAAGYQLVFQYIPLLVAL